MNKVLRQPGGSQQKWCTETRSVSNKPSLIRQYTLEPTSYSLQRVNPHTNLLKLQGCFPKHVQSYAAIVMSNTIRQLLSTRATSEPEKGTKVTRVTIEITSGKQQKHCKKSTINQSIPQNISNDLMIHYPRCTRNQQNELCSIELALKPSIFLVHLWKSGDTKYGLRETVEMLARNVRCASTCSGLWQPTIAIPAWGIGVPQLSQKRFRSSNFL